MKKGIEVKAKDSFMTLTIDNNYQGLHTEDFLALQRGETVTISNIPDICKEHLEKVKKEK